MSLTSNYRVLSAEGSEPESCCLSVKKDIGRCLRGVKDTPAPPGGVLFEGIEGVKGEVFSHTGI